MDVRRTASVVPGVLCASRWRPDPRGSRPICLSISSPPHALCPANPHLVNPVPWSRTIGLSSAMTCCVSVSVSVSVSLSIYASGPVVPLPRLAWSGSSLQVEPAYSECGLARAQFYILSCILLPACLLCCGLTLLAGGRGVLLPGRGVSAAFLSLSLSPTHSHTTHKQHTAHSTRSITQSNPWSAQSARQRSAPPRRPPWP